MINEISKLDMYSEGHLSIFFFRRVRKINNWENSTKNTGILLILVFNKIDFFFFYVPKRNDRRFEIFMKYLN